MDSGLLADYWTSRVVMKFIRSFSCLYQIGRADELKDDVVLLAYQYIEQQQAPDARRPLQRERVVEDCVSLMVPSVLKGAVRMEPLHFEGRLECTDGVRRFNCALLAGRYTLFVLDSPHLALWEELEQTLNLESPPDWSSTVSDETAQLLLSNVGLFLSGAMEREMMRPFLSSCRLKAVLLHAVCLGDYEALQWMVGLKCTQFCGSPFGAQICAERLAHLQRRHRVSGDAVAVDLQSTTIGTRPGGFTLIASDYEDDVVGGFMRTTRFEFRCPDLEQTHHLVDRLFVQCCSLC